MLLSIVIPAHNKVSFLKSAIYSILDEEEFGNSNNLIISDNSFNSDIKNLYNKEFAKNKNIKYFSSKKYNCLDSNVNRSIELATGKYAWVFGDDDLLVKGVIKEIMHFLNIKSPNLLICNSKSFNKSGIIESSRMPLGIKSIYNEEENNKFLQDLGGYLTYVGGIIVKKNLWIENYNKNKIGSFFAHIDCLASIKNNRKIHYFCLPVINMRLGSQTWVKNSFFIWYIYYPEIIWKLENYSDCAKNNLIPRNPLNSLKIMLAARAYSRINFHIFKKHIFRSENVYLINKILIFLIVLIPVYIFKKLYLILIFLHKKKHSTNFSPELAKAQLHSN